MCAFWCCGVVLLSQCILALWEAGGADISESSGFFPVQSSQDGCHRKSQPTRSPGSWDFRARKTCLDLLVDSLQSTLHLLRWCCYPASGSQTLDTSLLLQRTVLCVRGRQLQAGTNCAGSSGLGHISSTIKPPSYKSSGCESPALKNRQFFWWKST